MPGRAVVLAVGLIAVATLWPTGWESTAARSSPFCILCGARGLADFILNVGLFVPLGAALAASGRSLLGATGVGALLSLAIELLQLFVVAGRDAALGDLVANTIGTGAGWLGLRAGGRQWRIPARIAHLVPAMAAAAAVLMLLLGLWLLSPSFPASAYFPQWTPDFPNTEHYGGELVEARIGPFELPGPVGPMERSDSVRKLLESGAPLRLVMEAGPPPSGIAPVLRLVDREREVVSVSVDGKDLVYRHHRRGQWLRLDQGEIRFRAALATVRPGERVELRVDRTPCPPAGLGPCRPYCARVEGRRQCVRAPSVGDTWSLLTYRPGWPLPVREVLGYVWLSVLLLPAGLVEGRCRDRLTAGAVLLLGLTAGSLLLALPAPSIAELGAALVGIGVGSRARRLSTRWRGPRSTSPG